jgi:hypothetical protein
VGVHFFNPVAMMPLVEVVRTAATGDEAFRRAAAFVRKLDKLPLPVRDAPGFLVNAVLGPYMYEALRCVDEGIAPEAIDAALTAFGMPMGPIELVDTVGLDIAVAAGKALAGADAVLPRALADKVAAGQLGKKSGQGFYRWDGGKAQKAAARRAGGPRRAHRGAAAGGRRKLCGERGGRGCRSGRRRGYIRNRLCAVYRRAAQPFPRSRGAGPLRFTWRGFGLQAQDSPGVRRTPWHPILQPRQTRGDTHEDENHRPPDALAGPRPRQRPGLRGRLPAARAERQRHRQRLRRLGRGGRERQHDLLQPGGDDPAEGSGDLGGLLGGAADLQVRQPRFERGGAGGGGRGR